MRVYMYLLLCNRNELTFCNTTGGLKVWECSIDLVSTVLSEQTLWFPGPILEIGCGHALPGIAAFLKSNGSNDLVLIDFNADVLKKVSWPNIMKNCSSTSNVKCFAGEMTDVSAAIQGGIIIAPKFYNLILTSETLYNSEVSFKVSLCKA